MNDPVPQGGNWSVLTALLTLIPGGIAGAAAAALIIVRGRPISLLYLLAYVLIGAVSGAIGVGLDGVLVAHGWADLAGAQLPDGGVWHRALLFGFAFCVLFGALNLSAGAVLRAIGYRITLVPVERPADVRNDA